MMSSCGFAQKTRDARLLSAAPEVLRVCACARLAVQWRLHHRHALAKKGRASCALCLAHGARVPRLGFRGFMACYSLLATLQTFSDSSW